ncbi:MAG: SGNH/GDSL hydrolase family protein [Bacteroidota bacterium]
MKNKVYHLAIWALIMLQGVAIKVVAQVADPASYLSTIKAELRKQWPANRNINLVFHGHSVPSGYAKTPLVNTFGSYPYQLLALLKMEYPYAVINIIVTAKGGENSIQGAGRFERDALIHQPDVLFIDYALNELDTDPKETYAAWDSMIKKALARNIKVILLTPSPDQRVNLADRDNSLKRNTDQIIQLANDNHIGVANAFGAFNTLYAKGDSLKNYMAQVNHPNQSGNALIAQELLKWFK